ncbi:MAG: hypothetical protein I8H71_13435 [Xanthomonadaceae bacterium]|nr:hypothetical protein [Xanthomonadaceae bacterium]
MDALPFTAEAIKALAWPIAVVLVALMIRRPVIELLPFLRRLKYKEIELEFSKELAQLKSEVTASEPATSQQPPPSAPSASSNRLLNIAAISASAAILEAWSELESASVAVASSFWARPPSDVFKNARLGEYLLQCKVIDEKQLAVFNKLRALRNKAAHAIDLNLSEEEARIYIELATSLIAHIRST